MASPSIEVFPVGNGDMTLITTKNNKKILIDCYRRAGKEYDYQEDRLREHLNTDENGRLYVDVFVLTHPDADHITGPTPCSILVIQMAGMISPIKFSSTKFGHHLVYSTERQQKEQMATTLFVMMPSVKYRS